MRIGIIGAGNIGSALAKKFCRLGHSVKIANSRGPGSLVEVAGKTGSTPVEVVETVRGIDLLVIAIGEKGVPELPKGLLQGLPAETPVIDTGNYLPLRDGHIDAIEDGLTDSEWVAGILGRPVVKVFNNIITPNLANGGRPKGAQDRIAIPVSADNPKARQFVVALLDDLGFDGVDAGPLFKSWRQQPGTPAFATDYNVENLKIALAKADRSIMAEMRDNSRRIALGMPLGTQLGRLTMEQLTRLTPPPPQEQVRQIRAMWKERLGGF